MSMVLEESLPKGLEAKSHDTLGARIFLDVMLEYGNGGCVVVGDYRLSMKDLLALTIYALGNTNIEGETDPRLEFVKTIQKARLTDGFPNMVDGERVNPSAKRFVFS